MTFSLWWMWALYNLLSVPSFPVVLLYLLIFRSEYRHLWFIRRKLGLCKYEPGKFTVWIHAVSVGEVRAAGPLLRRLSARQIPVLLTVHTTNAYDYAVRSYSGARIEIMPFDFFPCLTVFMAKHHADWLLLVETEYWPNLIVQSWKRGTRVALINGRVSERMRCARDPWRNFLRRLFRLFDGFLMRNAFEEHRILEMGAPRDRVRTVGDLKFEVIADPSEEVQLKVAHDLPGLPLRKTLIAGSTHPGEEEILVASYLQVKREHPDAFLVIVPRHISRADEVVSLIHSRGLSARLRTDSGHKITEDILVVNTVGELLNFYAIGFIAFVGGSLIKRGGHNPVEPSSVGKICLFGPYMDNFIDVAQNLLEAGAAVVVRNANDLAEKWLHFIRNPGEAEAGGQRGRLFVVHHRGASAKILEWIGIHA
ncbi:MAG: 3-deoxy-D-manno-octulosonic acid transferase [bacterium JZ-2024 1]